MSESTTRLTILGCGGAAGTPSINGGWGKCDPDNPKNSRSRPSVLVEKGSHAILIDTSPDMRLQLLSTGTSHLDGVLFTHIHADHVHGIDDLREINRAMNAPIPIYGDAETLAPMKMRFDYAFTPLPDGAKSYFKPTLLDNQISDGDTFEVAGLTIQAFIQDHGWGNSMGYRMGPVAYSTDVVTMPEAAFEVLAGVDIWVVGALRDDPHPTHAHVEKALEWIERVRPRLAVLTHLSPDLDYDALESRLPEGVTAAFDGLVLESSES